MKKYTSHRGRNNQVPIDNPDNIVKLPCEYWNVWSFDSSSCKLVVNDALNKNYYEEILCDKEKMTVSIDDPDNIVDLPC